MLRRREGNKLLNYMHSVEQGDLTALSALRSAIAEGMTWDYPVYVLIGAEEAYLGLVDCRTRKQRKTLLTLRSAFETDYGIERATALEKFLIRWVFTGQLRMQFAHALRALSLQGDSKTAALVSALRNNAPGQLQAAEDYLDMARAVPRRCIDASASIIENEGDVAAVACQLTEKDVIDD